MSGYPSQVGENLLSALTRHLHVEGIGTSSSSPGHSGTPTSESLACAKTPGSSHKATTPRPASGERSTTPSVPPRTAGKAGSFHEQIIPRVSFHLVPTYPSRGIDVILCLTYIRGLADIIGRENLFPASPACSRHQRGRSEAVKPQPMSPG